MKKEKKNFCKCGCGQLVTNEFARGHCHRVVEKIPKPCKCGCGKLTITPYVKNHYYRVKKFATPEPQLCECGCGEYAPVTQGKAKRFILGHHHRIRSDETRKRMSESRKGKKRSDEYKEKMSKAIKALGRTGEKAPYYGYKHSESTKKKYSEDRKGRSNSCGPKISKRNKELWQDPDARKKWIECRLGEKSPVWKGGVTPIHYSVRSSATYAQWRFEVAKRDNFVCVICGQGQPLHIHHVVSFKSLMKKHNIKSYDDAINCKELWDIDNGITFCVKCHNEYHSINGR